MSHLVGYDEHRKQTVAITRPLTNNNNNNNNHMVEWLIGLSAEPILRSCSGESGFLSGTSLGQNRTDSMKMKKEDWFHLTPYSR